MTEYTKEAHDYFGGGAVVARRDHMKRVVWYRHGRWYLSPAYGRIDLHTLQSPTVRELSAVVAAIREMVEAVAKAHLGQQ